MKMGKQCFNFIPDPNLTPTVLAPIHVPLCSPAGYPAPNLTFPSTSPRTTAAFPEQAEKEKLPQTPPPPKSTTGI